MSRLALILSFLLYCCFVSAQNDPVLFTVEGVPVHVSEFDYIYSKNSGKNTDYSMESLKEYLDLYVKFKLKVQKAKDLKMDTIPALQQELAGYRKQLAKSYLTDKEVTEQLIKEAYERMKKDVELQQILIKINPVANRSGQEKTKEKADMIYNLLKEGKSFESLASKYSQDRFTNTKKGYLGYKTALFPNNFYNLETAAYETPKGKFSAPVKTEIGYHILKVKNIRDARGEMEVAHILIRKKSQRKQNSNAQLAIDSIYTKLTNGADFSELARLYSEDKSSADKGGYIGFFGINKYEKAFEDTAFGIMKDGSYSQPVESSVGWHIIKRISKKPFPTYEEARKTLRAKVQRDGRYKQATNSLVQNIKKSNDFSENKKVLTKWIEKVNSSIFKYNWNPTFNSEDVLFSFGKKEYTNQDFMNFVQKNARRRIQMEVKGPQNAIKTLYRDFVEHSAIKHEETQLEKKYPEFKALMREYEEGILLFEVTKNNVWDKASKDTVGLRNYYDNHQNNYTWKERAKVKKYTVNSTDKKLLKKFAKKAKCKSPDWLKNKYGDIFTVSDETLERGSKELTGMKFRKKTSSQPSIDEKSGRATIISIYELLPAAKKTLKEAKGYVEANYQDQLEREWVSSLRSQYKVVVDENVLKSLVK